MTRYASNEPIVMVCIWDLDAMDVAIRTGRQIAQQAGCRLHVVHTEPRENAYLTRTDALDRLFALSMHAHADTTVLYTNTPDASLENMLDRYAIQALVLAPAPGDEAEWATRRAEMGQFPVHRLRGAALPRDDELRLLKRLA